MPDTESLQQSFQFKEFPPVKFWSAKVVIDTPSPERLKKALGDSAKETGFTYSGFMLKDDSGKFEYHFSRYPRHKFGIATREQLNEALSALEEKLKSAGIGYQASIESEVHTKDKHYFRVLMGLQEGYDQEAKIHNMEEVKKALGKNADLNQAEIYSVGSWGSYSEPAVVIKGDEAQIIKVYELADNFHQSRLAVENMKKGESFMVETQHCIDPDPNPL